jgi:hypothetical protein
VIVPPVTRSVTLAVLGGIVVALAWPIRRAVKGTAPLRIDLFRAARTAVLAKACALAGALLAGFPLGLLLYMLTRTVLGSASGLVLTASAVVGGAVLLAGGLVAEWMCTIPPADGDEDEEPDAGTTRSHA